MSASVNPKKASHSWRRKLIRPVVIALFGYLGIILVLLLLENRLVYFPTPPSEFWQDPPASSGWQDVYLDSADGTRIHAWWCPHPAADGVMLYCHGNAGNLSHRAWMIQEIQKELNVSVLIFDYPGYGKSEGRPSEAGCYAAGEAAYRWLTEQEKVPGEKILLFGNSLGGGVATYLAAKHPYRALILSKTFTSLPEVGQHLYPWLPVRWLMRNRFDSLGRLKDCPGPVFITHGQCDTMIPCSHGEALYAAANEPKYFLQVETGDHNSPLDQEFFAVFKAFLARAETGEIGEPTAWR